ncbi:DNA repair protein RAD50 [Astathelohania contejeani]|uniref:DNA repair protein RAD50 n=1 Tax=Astathelohania contejeani TaxID=164912 RepID=A0ABQ7I088_9MICR|nr:DNA repair protein RAD50 [Thelohania contejeani]
MSTFDKLMIRGIRSFNPTIPNTLQLYTPLTLIVGPNGSGKTTIIECLKYITTGNLPPNTRGGAFIYDPKIAREPEVKAQIKLRLTTREKETIVCTRSLQLTQRKNRLEQKTLETLLWKINSRGEQVSISSRCADMDAELPYYLGVSSAMLEHVIFCHQEDSNWPLGEPGCVKKKLDDVFASSKYARALDVLRSERKELSASLRVKRVELDYLVQARAKRQSLARKINELEEAIAERNKRIESLDCEIKRIFGLEGELKDIIVNVIKLEEEIQALKNESEGIQFYLSQCSNQNINSDEIKKVEEEKSINEVINKLKKELIEDGIIAEMENKRNKYIKYKNSIGKMKENEEKRLRLIKEINENLKEYEIAVRGVQTGGKLELKALRMESEKRMEEIKKEIKEKNDDLILYNEKINKLMKEKLEIEHEMEHIDFKLSINICEDKISNSIDEIQTKLKIKKDLLNKALMSFEKQLRYQQMKKRKEEIGEISDVDITELRTEKETLEIKRNEIKSWKLFYKEEIKKVNDLNIELGLSHFEEVSLEKVENLDEINDIIAASSNAHLIYKNFQKMGIKKNECPLCKKGFCGAEKSEFFNRLENIILKIPETKKEAIIKKEKIESKIKRNELLNTRNKIIRSINTGLFGISEKDHESLYQAIFNYEKLLIEQLDLCNENLLKKTLLMQELKNINEGLKKDVIIYDSDKIRKEISELEDKLKKKRLIEEHNELKETKKNLEEKYKNIESNYKNYIDRRDELRSVLAKMMETQMRTKTKSQIYYNNIFQNMKELKNIEIISIEPIEFDEEEYENIKKINNEIKERLSFYIFELNKIEGIKLKIQEINKKKEKETQHVILNNKIEELKKTNKYGPSNLLKQKLDKLQEKKNSLENMKSVLLGENKQMKTTLLTYKNEMESDYKEDNYKSKYIECKTMEICLDDLDKCIKVLDRSIIEFHSNKINELNKTLKDLWTGTYKGNDIDWIELRSESEGNKMYNYRIVMVKNGIELDMRGRCSAGQKVIASILFRLALCETFSINCNIMALDEPTTNLDRENIESLAHTLNQIINERKNNFQLIVITHDEEFVQMMGVSGCEYFYRLERDENGDSIIERHNIG